MRARLATNKKRILVPSIMGSGGRRLLDARDDVEVVPFPTTVSADEFQTLLRSGSEVHGAILGLTRFGETECALARGLEVVARIGVGYDTIDVPALPAAEFLDAGRDCELFLGRGARAFPHAHAGKTKRRA
jgi:D-3-phosphoglycerate dehydrogenase / 2-oxoglutarate reductase